jgi:hypothetical protein
MIIKKTVVRIKIETNKPHEVASHQMKEKIGYFRCQISEFWMLREWRKKKERKTTGEFFMPMSHHFVTHDKKIVCFQEGLGPRDV